MTESQHADPRARKVALLYLVVATACGAGLLLLIQQYGPSLSRWLLRASRQDQLWFSALALLVLCLPLVLFAGWLWMYGVRVLRSDRHPPDGVKVVRDTPVARGSMARRYGRLYQTLAALLAAAAQIVAWNGWKLWRLP